ncbi:hypothetical protein [Thermosinus carboxydivorans]|uniref:hypothetical protein n=1 Tax=Thermosinus carboxydivorans TaxID=261685 RepID=UPI0002FA45E8|nr:hypothetical protein [Thermosinus carboxydivorans]
MTACPVCGQRTIGKVGADQYYCSECCVEFLIRGENVKIFNVETDGTLTLYNPLQDTAVNLQEG